MCPLGQKKLWPQGHSLNNYGRELPGDATYYACIKAVSIVILDKLFFMFSLRKTCGPLGITILVSVPYLEQTWERPNRRCYIANNKGFRQ